MAGLGMRFPQDMHTNRDVSFASSSSDFKKLRIRAPLIINFLRVEYYFPERTRDSFIVRTINERRLQTSDQL